MTATETKTVARLDDERLRYMTLTHGDYEAACQEEEIYRRGRTDRAGRQRSRERPVELAAYMGERFVAPLLDEVSRVRAIEAAGLRVRALTARTWVIASALASGHNPDDLTDEDGARAHLALWDAEEAFFALLGGGIPIERGVRPALRLPSDEE